MPSGAYACAVDRICPLLALSADLRTVTHGYDPDHRCTATAPALAVDRPTQQRLCLQEGHRECPRYREVASARAAGAPAPRPAPDATFVSTRLVIEADAAWHTVTTPARNLPRPGRRAAAGAVAVVVVGTLAAAGVSSAGFGLLGTATSAPQPTATPTPSPTPSPTPTPEPTPSVSPTPTASPTPPSTPAPSVRIYVVQPGDTLSAIAARFGVSVQAIINANGLANPNTLGIGQRLVIP